MTVSQQDLEKIVTELADKPGHEKVRVLHHALLTQRLGVKSQDIDFEKDMPEVNGRADAITGNTIFEFKRDLSQEEADAEGQLGRYMTAKRKQSSDASYIGLATDGSEYIAYAFREDAQPIIAERYAVDKENPEGLLNFLRRVAVFERNLRPDFDSIKNEFGKQSIVWKKSEVALEALWNEVCETPDAQLKYQLWQQLLSFVYGVDIDDPSLFLRHTYLSLLAKSVAWAALLDEMPKTAQEIITGAGFAQRNITGLGGEDFFGWIAHASGGDDFVKRLTTQAGRFQLYDANTDVMKGLYESLIDPEERHTLGEYYTPDWLAVRICATAITDPLSQKVLDPSCGSGTFVFHAVRRIIAEAEKENIDPVRALECILSNVKGIDIHPVAVTVAQVTFLLAILPLVKSEHIRTNLSIPIYLGDALQWGVDRPSQDDIFATETGGGLKITVPEMRVGTKTLGPLSLVFPLAVMANHDVFDETVQTMLDLSAANAPVNDFRAWIRKNVSIVAFDYDPLADTYKNLKQLQKEDRNHIWGFVARNLARPVWLSDTAKADVLIGNPPWVAYRYMKGVFRERFKKECKKTNLWVGGKEAPNQDLSAYFFMRAAQLYLKPKGHMALVMPAAALSRKAYEKFRQGHIHDGRGIMAGFKVPEAWSLGADCQPLFPVPACVLFAERTQDFSEQNLRHPDRVVKISGTLPRRDAQAAEANQHLADEIIAWPVAAGDKGASYYFKFFKAGANLMPRRLALVTFPTRRGRLPTSLGNPQVTGKTGNLDKPPWRDIPPLQGRIEEQFLKPVLLGASIAPFRLLTPETGIIPVLEQGGDDGTPYAPTLLDGQAAQQNGFIHLAKWMKEAEVLWDEHKTREMSLIESYNFQGKLTGQYPISGIRVVYPKSGTHLASCVVKDSDIVIETSLFWATMNTLHEAQYLTAILNSDTAAKEMAPHQSQGQWGARDIVRTVLIPAWPRFDENSALHQEIVAAAEQAETIAAQVDVPTDLSGMQFTRIRSKIRAALHEDGIADTINMLTARLLKI